MVFSQKTVAFANGDHFCPQGLGHDSRSFAVMLQHSWIAFQCHFRVAQFKLSTVMSSGLSVLLAQFLQSVNLRFNEISANTLTMDDDRRI